MMTSRPEIFEHNPDPSNLIPVDDYYVQLLRFLGRSVVQPYYAKIDPENRDRDIFGSDHILTNMCRAAGIGGEIALRPYFYLTSSELQAGVRARRQVAIQSTASGAALPFANKEWQPDRFASVVAGLPAGMTAVQLGIASDPALPGTVDLRGRSTLREAAAVIAQSEVFIGLEGFLAHLARAVDCPAVVVLGGRVSATTTGYSGNEYLSHEAPCAPCGQRDLCDRSRECIMGVRVDEVLDAIGRVVQRGRAPLPTTRVQI